MIKLVEKINFNIIGDSTKLALTGVVMFIIFLSLGFYAESIGDPLVYRQKINVYDQYGNVIGYTDSYLSDITGLGVLMLILLVLMFILFILTIITWIFDNF